MITSGLREGERASVWDKGREREGERDRERQRERERRITVAHKFALSFFVVVCFSFVTSC